MDGQYRPTKSGPFCGIKCGSLLALREIPMVPHMRSSITLFPFIAALVLSANWLIPPTSAQQVTGTPGSPSATTTLEGQQLPPPPQKFEGKIERNAAQSTPYWPARVVPPKGAPNILLIMTDDTGFGVSSAFGGVIPTPKSRADRCQRPGLHQLQLDGVFEGAPALLRFVQLDGAHSARMWPNNSSHRPVAAVKKLWPSCSSSRRV